MARNTRTAESLAPLLGRDLLLRYTSSSGFFEDADWLFSRRGVDLDVQRTDRERMSTTRVRPPGPRIDRDRMRAQVQDPHS